MIRLSERSRCLLFLEENGWSCDIDNPTDCYTSYWKDGYFGIDIDDNEIVFINSTGDFIHIAINYYTLIGVLMEYRQIDCNYKQV